EVGTHERRPYLALELMEGGSLSDALGGQPLPPRVAAGLVETLAGATDYAHRQGVVHRDLNPANVLLSFSGRPRGGAEDAPPRRRRPWKRCTRWPSRSRCNRRACSPRCRATWKWSASSAWRRSRPGATPAPPSWPTTCATSSRGSRSRPAASTRWNGRGAGRG